MEAKFWRAALCVAVGALFNPATASTVVDAADFFRSFAGQYRIVLHGGEVPHSNTVALVEPLEDQGFMQMGYCPSGGGFCDVGYLDFAYSQTSVEKTELSDGRLLFRIQVAETQRLLRFEWEVDEDCFRFRNLQYSFPSGEVAVLEHELKAIPGAMDYSNQSQVSIDPAYFIQSHLGN